MLIWGLHILDILVVAAYVLIVLWIGKWVSEKNTNTDEFYLAGRKLGKITQFFLNFGCSTNADQAVAVAREIYRQGIGGMWIQFLVLFLTPFYWFTTMLFRRVRLTTIGDFFRERFDSPFLGGSYAVFMLLLSLLGGGVGYMVAAKTMVAMTPKTMNQCTVEEQESISGFDEFQEMRSRVDQLTPDETVRYQVLLEKNKRGELKSFVSHTNPVVFYFVYAVIVGVYTMLGGFRAAAITDTIQGLLIVLFSCILIPIGLSRIGGFSGLHAKVPDHMFNLFGNVNLSEYAWYTILAMVLSNLVSIIAVASGMQTAGSARNENAARIGMIGGMYLKRVIMIFWALTGLLAIGLYAGKIHDPDLIWGHMAKELLFPGGVGLMLVGILAANMSTLDASSVSYSALFIKNIYEPLRPGRADSHYLAVGRLVVGATLLGGIAIALLVDNLLELFKYIISIPAIFGAPLWLGFLWRRVTRTAVIVQVGICLAIYALIPNLFTSLNATRTHGPFLQETDVRWMRVEAKALKSDVEQGLAQRVGDPVEKEVRIESFGVFFDRVARIDPEDPNSQKIGLGRFHAEIWMLSWFGIDFSGFSKAQLVAARFFFDAFFPFLLLFFVSWITKPVPKERMDRFFAKIHTPVQGSGEEERKALERSYAHPEQFEKNKLFRKSQWEILKPGKSDILGFGGSWILVGIIILLLWGMVSIR